MDNRAAKQALNVMDEFVAPIADMRAMMATAKTSPAILLFFEDRPIKAALPDVDGFIVKAICNGKTLGTPLYPLIDAYKIHRLFCSRPYGKNGWYTSSLERSGGVRELFSQNSFYKFLSIHKKGGKLS